jgi:hypothetical protein
MAFHPSAVLQAIPAIRVLPATANVRSTRTPPSERLSVERIEFDAKARLAQNSIVLFGALHHQLAAMPVARG